MDHTPAFAAVRNDCRRCQLTYKTAAVQVGKRSKAGMTSAKIVGRNAQCQPSNLERIKAAAISMAISAGEKAPEAKNGSATI